ncbi:S49 family peptidase [Rhizobium sp. Leaf386]|uniref:S49 family peptidase n=1 Tax=Rhizobium sp. Leaf386 TaxID=1736359 RepID=UPI000715946C|nr:S49 family peptidase [Rhizobium sp. Leaf386]KQS90306.1 hypothetical protein ASG50_07570 [Rhizobium sp. Leaf386]
MTPDIMTLVSTFLGSVGGQSRRGLSPWAIRAEEVAASLQMVSGIRLAGASSDSFGIALAGGERLAPGSFASRVGSVAVVPVYGPLVARYNRSYWSYEEIVRDLRLAANSPGITSILMEIDSPGGIGNRIDTVTAEIAAIRQVMPVHAHVSGLGASAAYWIPAHCEKVTAERTALVGSVGALIHYVDMEGILTRLGGSVVQAIAETSPNKRLSRDSDEGRAELQAIVDDAGEMFVQALVQARGVAREVIMNNYGQGLVFTAREALSRGMIDGIGSLDEVLAGLAARPTSSNDAGAAAASTPEKESAMPDLNNSTALAAGLTLATLKAENPALYAELQAAGVAEGAKAERERQMGIDKVAAGLSGVDTLVAEMKADGKTTPEQAAMRLLEASKTTLSERIKGFEAMDKAAEGVTSTLSGGNGSETKTFPATEDGWKAEWSATPKLQEDYPTAEAYAATKKRDARKFA